ncbi:hypothetical protein M758_10G137700 [Ceratodon purpureus]|uniref:Secreted protein n=1 Tax=Ceratodon purpureus TaxID=3225 RepID=A0A8T0GSM5_CERPU|nr:hypothetical protein KC19_10G142500 [Ceratodon purpureus]KAG0604020.1 hypothetical protein M758_10G137700 [Ceratodon purpureus]
MPVKVTFAMTFAIDFLAYFCKIDYARSKKNNCECHCFTEINHEVGGSFPIIGQTKGVSKTQNGCPSWWGKS